MTQISKNHTVKHPTPNNEHRSKWYSSFSIFGVHYSTLFILFLFTFLLANTSGEKETRVLIQTDLGDIKLMLYNQTPRHRDNFIKLIREKFYDSLLFHRVIPGFVIQGGDPDSKNAKAGQFLGNGDVGYTIPAEFHPGIIHKRGVLAAAREGDYINPAKASSGCQFYIVTGKVFNDHQLDSIETTITKQKIISKLILQEEHQAMLVKMKHYQQESKFDSIRWVNKQLEPFAEKELSKNPLFRFSREQRKTYTTIGGTPRLDGNYTIFGEVTEGMEVVDKIVSARRDSSDRPFRDIRMTIKIIE